MAVALVAGCASNMTLVDDRPFIDDVSAVPTDTPAPPADVASDTPAAPVDVPADVPPSATGPWSAASTALSYRAGFLGVAPRDGGCGEDTAESIEVATRMYRATCVGGVRTSRERLLTPEQLRTVTDAASLLRVQRDLACSGHDGLFMHIGIAGPGGGTFQRETPSCSVGPRGDTFEPSSASALLAALTAIRSLM